LGSNLVLEYRPMSDSVSVRRSRIPILSMHSLLVGGEALSPLILVHGAANSARVWTFWQNALAHRGWPSHALDLAGHGHSVATDVGVMRMADYADDVLILARALRRQTRTPFVTWGSC
jgi:pimeloyl-ACP methyl ester carboxylesterase